MESICDTTPAAPALCVEGDKKRSRRWRAVVHVPRSGSSDGFGRGCAESASGWLCATSSCYSCTGKKVLEYRGVLLSDTSLVADFGDRQWGEWCGDNERKTRRQRERSTRKGLIELPQPWAGARRRGGGGGGRRRIEPRHRDLIDCSQQHLLDLPVLYVVTVRAEPPKVRRPDVALIIKKSGRCGGGCVW